MPKKVRRSASRSPSSSFQPLPRPALSQRWQAYSLMLLNTLCWGAAFVVVKPAFEVTTPFRYLFYRFLLASLLSIPFLIYYWPKIKKPATQIWKIIGLELLGTTLALALVYEGLARTNVIEASILTAILPAFVTLGGVLLLKEKMERHEWLGSSIALFATIAVIIQPVLMGTTPLTQISLVGNLLILGYNFTSLFYFPLAKKYYTQLPKLFVASLSFVVGAVSFGLLSLIETGNWDLWQTAVRTDLTAPSVWLAFGYMATFGSIIGLTAYIKGQDLIEASEASIFTYLGLPITLGLAHWLLGERLTLYQSLILLILVVGVVIAEKRFKKLKK